MPVASAPYGLSLTYLAGGSPRAVRRAWPLTANTDTGFFEGDILNIAAGVVIPTATTPTTTLNTASPVAIFSGCEYNTLQGRVFSNTFPAAGYTAFSGYGPITIFGYDDPDLEFMVQGSGPLTTAMIGLNAQLTNFAAGNVTTGKSKIQLLYTSPATTNTFGVHIVGIAPGPNNTSGDLFTDVICRWNQNVHQYRNILGA